ncbi:hypothetical protein BGZ98_007159 [Dissophora globulifera]|nr:hypothetical protein BGZ98_007159 [Dissophora globulifera]
MLTDQESVQKADYQALNNDHFDKTSADYDLLPQAKEMTGRTSKVVIEEFIALTSVDRVKDATILDFGCGTGLCTFLVAPHVKQVLGVDASAGMLKHLNFKLTTLDENADLRDKIKTVNHLVTQESPLPEPEYSQFVGGSNDGSGGFDMIYTSFVLHHIEDVQGIVDALVGKLLKKDGWFFAIDFSGSEEHGFSHGHGHNHSHGQGHNHDQGQGHNHGHGQGQGHAHNHGDSHGHLHHQGEMGKKKQGKVPAFVAHKSGFTPDSMTETFKKAGLVDISAKLAFGFNFAMNDNKWTEVIIVKGRRA